MNKQQFGRFNKIYNFLSKLDSRNFTLISFVDGNIQDLGKRKAFNTSKACFSAYLPIVFPKDWHFVEDIIPLLKRGSSKLYSKDIAMWFGLDEQEVLKLTVAKNYRKPNIESVLYRMRQLSKSYGFILKVNNDSK